MALGHSHTMPEREGLAFPFLVVRLLALCLIGKTLREDDAGVEIEFLLGKYGQPD